MIKAILFDLGNTLYSNKEFDKQYPKRLIELLAKDKNISIEEAEIFLKNTKKKFDDKSDTHITKVATMKALGYSRSQVHDAFCRNKPEEYLKPDPELKEMLERISQKYKLAIISNFRSTHSREILNALGVDNSLFSIIIGEDNVANIKPDPEPFNKALDYLKIKPGEAVYVADSPTKDLIPAKRIGFKTIHVSRKTEHCKHADETINEILELDDALKKL